MSRFFLWAKAFNDEWNDLPHRALWVLALCAAFFAGVKLFPYVAPFALAAAVSAMIERPVRALTAAFRRRPRGRAAAAGAVVLLVTAMLLLALLLLTLRLVEEGKALIAAAPALIERATAAVTGWVEAFPFGLNLRDSRLERQLIDLLKTLGAQLAARAATLASGAAMGALKTATSLPTALLFLVLTLLGAFYLSRDREQALGWLRRMLPEKALAPLRRMRAGVGKCVVCQVRATIMLLFIIFIELTLGFCLMRIEYAVALAALIAAADALPVIGAGLFLLPAAAHGFLTGSLLRGIGFAALYAVTAVTRQLMEPKLIGRQLGLHPLSTMTAMYAGLRAMGFAGMLLGPLLLLVCKVTLTADPAQRAAFEQPLEPILRRRGGESSGSQKN